MQKQRSALRDTGTRTHSSAVGTGAVGCTEIRGRICGRDAVLEDPVNPDFASDRYTLRRAPRWKSLPDERRATGSAAILFPPMRAPMIILLYQGPGNTPFDKWCAMLVLGANTIRSGALFSLFRACQYAIAGLSCKRFCQNALFGVALFATQ